MSEKNSNDNQLNSKETSSKENQNQNNSQNNSGQKKIYKATETIFVYKKWCKKCGICVEFCPKKCLGFDEDGYPIPLDKECIRCGLCDIRCPDFAITGMKDW